MSYIYTTGKTLSTSSPFVSSYSSKGMSNLDVDVIAYQKNIVTNGGSISPSTIICVDRLVKKLKGNNLWSKIKELGVFCGDNLNSALIKLKYTKTSGKYLLNSGFTESDFTPHGINRGLYSNGTKHLNTSFNPQNELSYLNCSLSVRTLNHSYWQGYSIGVSEASNFYITSAYDNLLYIGIGDGYNTSDWITTGVGEAHFLINRIGSSATKYVDNTPYSASSISAAQFPNMDIRILCVTYNGAAFMPAKEKVNFYHIGEGFTQPEALNFITIVKEFEGEMANDSVSNFISKSTGESLGKIQYDKNTGDKIEHVYYGAGYCYKITPSNNIYAKEVPTESSFYFVPQTYIQNASFETLIDPAWISSGNPSGTSYVWSAITSKWVQYLSIIAGSSLSDGGRIYVSMGIRNINYSYVYLKPGVYTFEFYSKRSVGDCLLDVYFADSVTRINETGTTWSKKTIQVSVKSEGLYSILFRVPLEVKNSAIGVLIDNLTLSYSL